MEVKRAPEFSSSHKELSTISGFQVIQETRQTIVFHTKMIEANIRRNMVIYIFCITQIVWYSKTESCKMQNCKF